MEEKARDEGGRCLISPPRSCHLSLLSTTQSVPIKPTKMQSPSSPPSHRAFTTFPSTSLSSPSRSSPYVTDQPLSQLNASLGGRPLSQHGSSSFTNTAQQAGGKHQRELSQDQGQSTTEVIYEAPENGLEIEVRDPRTQGNHRLSTLASPFPTDLVPYRIRS